MQWTPPIQQQPHRPYPEWTHSISSSAGLRDVQMQDMAREWGYSETAFLTSGPDEARRGRIRYFSPGAEVPFCGHATVATAVALAEKFGAGQFFLDPAAGEVVLATADSDQSVTASFTSVEPAATEIDPAVLERLLALLSLDASQLHPDFPGLIYGPSAPSRSRGHC
ncbi:PhzF family phenazine biosynthesis protein [Arthrobacter sp. LAPM80]|uniref:PhzF family phenazine biosynthesis protein n=1 Tax=Arthrobacter sp. LAPM80 TaxID=3141788 RepID=UPI00398AFEB3